MESLYLMRRILKLSLTCLAAGAVTACEPDTVITTEVLPYAGVRFINAVPDTAAMAPAGQAWSTVADSSADAPK